MTFETQLLQFVIALMLPLPPLIAAIILLLQRVYLGGATAISVITAAGYAYLFWRTTGWLIYLVEQKLALDIMVGPFLILGVAIGFFLLSLAVVIWCVSLRKLSPLVAELKGA